MDFKYFLYQHIRKDSGKIFYVGVGTKKKNHGKTIKSEYWRAFSKQRNNLWHKVVNKTDYKVEILMESDDYNTIKKVEIELVALYGRKNLGTGELVNLTNGGDGVTGIVFTDEHRKNLSLSQKGKVMSEEQKEHLRKINTGRFWTDQQKKDFKKYITYGLDHPTSRIILSLNTGVFFYTVNEASEAYNIKSDHLGNMLRGHRRNWTDLIFADNTDNIYPLIPEVKPYVNLSENNVGEKNSRSIKVINKETGKLYACIKYAHVGSEYSYQHFRSMLNPNNKTVNKTPFEYYDEEKHKHLICAK